MTRTNMTNAEADQAADRAEQGAPGAPEKAPSNKGASQRKRAPNSQKAAKPGKTTPLVRTKKARAGRKATRTTQAKQARTPRADSKRAKVLAMIGRTNGATLAEIIAYASHCTSPGRCEEFSLTKRLFDNLTPLPFCGGMSPGSS